MTIAGIGGLGLHSLPVSVPFFLLGTLLLVQATRVRFSFSEDDLEVLIKVVCFFSSLLKKRKIVCVFSDYYSDANVCGRGAQENSDEASELEESTNSFVGGMNKWKYSSFVNWELWWPDFPILVYFKETQTKPEGQIHFFPVIMDGRELYKVNRPVLAPVRMCVLIVKLTPRCGPL